MIRIKRGPTHELRIWRPGSTRWQLRCCRSQGAGPYAFDGSGGRVEQLIPILQSKAEEARLGDEQASSASGQVKTADSKDSLSDWRRRLGNADGRYQYFRRTTELRFRTSAGVGPLRLEMIPEAINPAFTERAPGEPIQLLAERLFRRAVSSDYVLAKAVDRQRLEGSDAAHVADRVGELRADVVRLEEEFRRRIGATRSRGLALVHRFKQRAEWHDCQRLNAVA